MMPLHITIPFQSFLPPSYYSTILRTSRSLPSTITPPLACTLQKSSSASAYPSPQTMPPIFISSLLHPSHYFPNQHRIQALFDSRGPIIFSTKPPSKFLKCPIPDCPHAPGGQCNDITSKTALINHVKSMHSTQFHLADMQIYQTVNLHACPQCDCATYISEKKLAQHHRA